MSRIINAKPELKKATFDRKNRGLAKLLDLKGNLKVANTERKSQEKKAKTLKQYALTTQMRYESRNFYSNMGQSKYSSIIETNR